MLSDLCWGVGADRWGIRKLFRDQPNMRQWLANFFLSGQFVYWLAGLGVVLLVVLPDSLSDFLLGHGLLVGTGAFTGWLVLRFIRDMRKWGIKRALFSYFVLPSAIAFIIALLSLLITGLSWLFGKEDAFQGSFEVFWGIISFSASLLQDPWVHGGLLLGGLIHLLAAYRDRQVKQSVDYLAAIQLLRQFLHYYLKAWRMRPAKKTPFQHEWSARPEDVGEPSDDELHPYLDLLPRRSLWQRLKSAFHRG